MRAHADLPASEQEAAASGNWQLPSKNPVLRERAGALASWPLVLGQAVHHHWGRLLAVPVAPVLLLRHALMAGAQQQWSSRETLLPTRRNTRVYASPTASGEGGWEAAPAELRSSLGAAAAVEPSFPSAALAVLATKAQHWGAIGGGLLLYSILAAVRATRALRSRHKRLGTPAPQRDRHFRAVGYLKKTSRNTHTVVLTSNATPEYGTCTRTVYTCRRR